MENKLFDKQLAILQGKKEGGELPNHEIGVVGQAALKVGDDLFYIGDSSEKIGFHFVGAPVIGINPDGSIMVGNKYPVRLEPGKPITIGRT